MAFCMMTPSHCLKHRGFIIKLINKDLWHLFQWIVIKVLKMPVSKTRLQIVCCDNVTPSGTRSIFGLTHGDRDKMDQHLQTVPNSFYGINLLYFD